jgi:hypothetical protein
MNNTTGWLLMDGGTEAAVQHKKSIKTLFLFSTTLYEKSKILMAF